MQQHETTRKRSVAGNVIRGSLGNLIEWYDWYAYAAFSVYFASAFFPSGDTTAQLLNTAGVFAVGFLMRPVGGWLFGWYADRNGRRASLTLSVTPDGRRVARHRTDARVRRRSGPCADHPRAGQVAPGAVPRRRVRHVRDLPERGGDTSSSWLLLVVPVRHPDQRSADRAGRADHPAAVPHRRARWRPGAGGRLRHRRVRRDHRDVAAARRWTSRRTTSSRSATPVRQARKPASPARAPQGVPDRRRPDPRRHRLLLHLHDVPAEVHDQHQQDSDGGRSRWINFVALLVFVVLQPLVGALLRPGRATPAAACVRRERHVADGPAPDCTLACMRNSSMAPSG